MAVTRKATSRPSSATSTRRSDSSPRLRRPISTCPPATNTQSSHGSLASAQAPLTTSLKQLAGHDHALNLVRSLVDLGDLCVPHHALDWVVVDVAIPAKQLDGVGRDFHRHVGSE